MTAAQATPDADARALLSEAVRLADAALERWLPPGDEAPARLHQAMRYSVFAGGKRLRPALVLAGARAAGGAPEEALGAAMAAVEVLHTYTLVHDDLPAMDDDDLRRGRAGFSGTAAPPRPTVARPLANASRLLLLPGQTSSCVMG